MKYQERDVPGTRSQEPTSQTQEATKVSYKEEKKGKKP